MQKPAERPCGVEALMRDNSDDRLVLVEHREFDPSTMTLDEQGFPTTSETVG